MTPTLTDAERARYAWQLDVPDFGEIGQERLKRATVFISRIGGVGGVVAQQLTAAGVGRLRLAHAGNLRSDDLNRQLLMTADALGKPRIEIAPQRLRDLNPDLVVEGIGENVHAGNAERLLDGVDLVVSCAPLFEERLAMNREAVRRGIPFVDCAMFELQIQLLSVIPRRSACLNCLYPDTPPIWKRRFPVLGAVAGTIGSLGAMEAIKLLANLGTPLTDTLLFGDLRDFTFRRFTIARRNDCPTCGAAS